MWFCFSVILTSCFCNCFQSCVSGKFLSPFLSGGLSECRTSCDRPASQTCCPGSSRNSCDVFCTQSPHFSPSGSRHYFQTTIAAATMIASVSGISWTLFLSTVQLISILHCRMSPCSVRSWMALVRVETEVWVHIFPRDQAWSSVGGLYSEATLLLLSDPKVDLNDHTWNQQVSWPHYASHYDLNIQCFLVHLWIHVIHIFFFQVCGPARPHFSTTEGLLVSWSRVLLFDFLLKYFHFSDNNDACAVGDQLSKLRPVIDVTVGGRLTQTGHRRRES